MTRGSKGMMLFEPRRQTKQISVFGTDEVADVTGEDAQHDLDVDLSRSVVIGDSYSDLELGWSVGARSTLVLTGFGQGYYEHQRNGWARQPDWVAPNLYSALMDIFSDIFSEADA